MSRKPDVSSYGELPCLLGHSVQVVSEQPPALLRLPRPAMRVARAGGTRMDGAEPFLLRTDHVARDLIR